MLLHHYNYINPQLELSYLLLRKGDNYHKTREDNKREEAWKRLDPRCSIGERSKIVHPQGTHWRLGRNTMGGKERKVIILTLAERANGYLLTMLLEKVSARGIRETSVWLFKDIPTTKKQIIHHNNCCELAEHELAKKQTSL